MEQGGNLISGAGFPQSGGVNLSIPVSIIRPENRPSRSSSRTESIDIIGIPHKSMDMGPGFVNIVDMLVGTILATSLLGNPRISAGVPGQEY